MKLQLVEIGETRIDVQTEIKDFNGTLEDYRKMVLDDARTNPNFNLVNLVYVNMNQGLLVEYLKKGIPNIEPDKFVSRYVLPIPEENTKGVTEQVLGSCCFRR